MMKANNLRRALESEALSLDETVGLMTAYMLDGRILDTNEAAAGARQILEDLIPNPYTASHIWRCACERYGHIHGLY